MSTPTIDKYTKLFNDFRIRETGTLYKITIPDADATAAAREYIENNKAQVQNLLKESTGKSFEIVDPVITFSPDVIHLSVKIKKSVVKINASASARVTWDGTLHVEALSVDVPIISISPEKINPAIKTPIAQVMNKVLEFIDIRTFQIKNGAAYLEGVKKMTPVIPASMQTPEIRSAFPTKQQNIIP